MTPKPNQADVLAIAIALRYFRATGRRVVRIPPSGAIDEITTVDLRDLTRPVVTREPSGNFAPGRSRK